MYDITYVVNNLHPPPPPPPPPDKTAAILADDNLKGILLNENDVIRISFTEKWSQYSNWQ